MFLLACDIIIPFFRRKKPSLEEFASPDFWVSENNFLTVNLGYIWIKIRRHCFLCWNPAQETAQKSNSALKYLFKHHDNANTLL